MKQFSNPKKKFEAAKAFITRAHTQMKSFEKPWKEFENLWHWFHYSSHLSVLYFLKKAGFRWEVRNLGGLKLGLLRKTLSPKTSSPGRRHKRLVVVPGLGDTPLSWLTLFSGGITELREKGFHEIVFVDFPGFSGFLKFSQPFHDFQTLTQAFNDLMDSLHPDVILGHSLGGWLTATYATHCGQGIRPKVTPSLHRNYAGPEKIILMNPSGIGFKRDELRNWRKRFYEESSQNFDEFQKHICYRHPLWFKLVKSEMASFFQKKEIQEFIRSIRLRYFLNRDAKNIRASVRLIWGEKDTMTPAQWIYDWLEVLGPTNPDVRATYIKDCGHSPQFEVTALTRRLILDELVGRGHLTASPSLRTVSAPSSSASHSTSG